jgi:16S rRNA processing protein RimM
LNKLQPKKDIVLIGKIVGAHGVMGTSKIQSYAESLEIYKPGTTLFILSPDGSEYLYEINWIKPHSRGALIDFKEVIDRERAKTLIGSELYIDRSALPELETGTYYWFDLIGLNVYTSENEHLGRLDSVIETGANDIYVIKDGNREILVPALKSVVKSIDAEAKIMRVELPDGLNDQ